MTAKQIAAVEDALTSINDARSAIVEKWTPEQIPFLDKVDDALVDASAKLKEALK